MRSNFAAADKATARFEGGNVDDKADRGGRTSRGVTQRTYNDYRKSKGQSATDVYLMTEEERAEIYLTRYWVPTGCDQLAIGPDACCHDYSVNSGVSRGKAAGVATHNYPPVDAVHMISARRTSFVEGIKNFAKFRKGVLARVASMETIGVKMAMAASGAPETLISATLAVKAKSAEAKSAKSSSSATAASVTTGGVGVSTAAAGTDAAHTSATVLLVLAGFAVLAALVGVYFAYHATREKARADAFRAG